MSGCRYQSKGGLPVPYFFSLGRITTPPPHPPSSRPRYDYQSIFTHSPRRPPSRCVPFFRSFLNHSFLKFLVACVFIERVCPFSFAIRSCVCLVLSFLMVFSFVHAFASLHVVLLTHHKQPPFYTYNTSTNSKKHYRLVISHFSSCFYPPFIFRSFLFFLLFSFFVLFAAYAMLHGTPNPVLILEYSHAVA